MADTFTSPIAAVAATLLVFWMAQAVYARWTFPLFNPVLLSILVLMGLLKAFQIPYERYNEGGKYISFLLGPAVVALGVPLYQQLDSLKRHGVSLALSLLLGSITGVVSAAGLAGLMGASRMMLISIAPKSVTTPIAMGIVEKLGGIPPLTASLVILTGLLGAAVGPALLRLLGVTSPTAFGLAMGAAAHAIGTSRAMEDGSVQGASAGLALCLNGIITALLTPVLLKLLIIVMDS
ncbi:CidB/LrgB family autolysis modulator [candidate division KSB3 bacterium]|uniref:CidB/LrgB family autolysis modulator n=1 Tax=candidate division KSB3 bacterium TaxID=2044937 RepID=A0A2G6E1A0_9BACT|nr:MAG: CidB/LrgB family autolysis modulator [candidate division KSB3 bacterium]PIE28535.1 MAG: CidB/LrgB family autolysis modulator [candidate division KSB3 bacterium]